MKNYLETNTESAEAKGIGLKEFPKREKIYFKEYSIAKKDRNKPSYNY